MFTKHYVPWRESRMKWVHSYFGDGLKDKTVLEIGCGHGDIGNMFHELGAIVSCCDARKEHLLVVNERWPHLKTFEFDSDKDLLHEQYDIIVHWGLLYHMNPDSLSRHLADIADHCTILLLETEVCDSHESMFVVTKEAGFDQAFNGVGIRPSPSYVEGLLSDAGFEFEMIMDPILNEPDHKYTWPLCGAGSCKPGYRRFWRGASAGFPLGPHCGPAVEFD